MLAGLSLAALSPVECNREKIEKLVVECEAMSISRVKLPCVTNKERV